MKRFKLRTLAATLAAVVGMSCLSAVPAAAAASGVEPEPSETVDVPAYGEVIEALNRANGYRQKTWSYNAWVNGYHPAFWDTAAYHTGNMEAYYATGNEIYRQYSENWADSNGWMGSNNTDKEKWGWGYNDRYGQAVNLFGDWQICFQSYIDLYNSERMEPNGKDDDNKIFVAKDSIDYQMTVDPSQPRYDGDPLGYWWWADALYMVPPVFTKLYATTGNIEYLDKMFEYYKFAVELMYDGPNGIPTVEKGYDGYTTQAGEYKRSGTKDGFYLRDAYFSDSLDYKYLFYRDGSYVYPLRPNLGHENEKNFWARGNGWVFAGLAKILPEIPESHDSYDYLKTIYLQMAKAIIDCQRQDDQGRGFWTQSMLQNYPTDDSYNPYGYETSGTAFFTYGLAWGLNSGLLDEETYLQPTLRAWKYLAEVALQSDGKVGYCQPVGSNATSATSRTTDQPFGYGAFLLAASEMSKLVGGVQGDVDESGQPNGDIYPYLLHKMVGKYAFELGSPHLFKDGQILHIDDSDYGVVPFKDDDGSVWLPLEALDKLGIRYGNEGSGIVLFDPCSSQPNIFVIPKEINGIKYFAVSDYNDTGKNSGTAFRLYTFESEDGNDLYILAHSSKFFYDCDKNAVEMLRSMIGQIERYPARPGQETEPEPDTDLPYGNKVELDAGMIEASDYQNEPDNYNPGDHAIDGDYNTYWAVEGENSLTIALNDELPISCVGVYIRKYDDTRTVKYKWQYSADGYSYIDLTDDYENSVISGGQWEYTDLKGQTARYVRLMVNGNSNLNNNWASVSEISVYTGAPEIIEPETEKLSITEDMYSVTGEPESGNNAANIFDGNKDTYWAVEKQNYLNIDLGGLKRIAYVDITLRDYNPARNMNYSIEHGVSFDKRFTVDFDGSTLSYTSEKRVVRHKINDDAKYIIIGVNGSFNGSDENNWFSLCEVEVYVYPQSDAAIQGTEPAIKAELNYVYDKNIVENVDEYATVDENDLAILFTYENLPAGASLQIRSGDNANDPIIFTEEPLGGGTVTIVPMYGNSNRIYRASIVTNTGEILAVTDASLYSVVAEHLNTYAAMDYAAEDVEFNKERLAKVVKVLNLGGVYLTKTGALTHEAAMLMDKKMGENVFTLKPELVKMGIAFYYDGVNSGYAAGVKFNTYSDNFDRTATAGDVGYYDTMTINGDSATLSRSQSFNALFPGAADGSPSQVTVGLPDNDEELPIPAEGGEL